ALDVHHDLWSNARPMWMHLSAAIVFCSLSYACLRVAGYTEEISLRLSIIFLTFSLGVPVVTAAQSDRGGWHLSTVGSKFLVALVILDISILAVGPIAASWIVHLILDRAGKFLLPRVGAGIIAATFGGLVLLVLARVPVVLAKLLC